MELIMTKGTRIELMGGPAEVWYLPGAEHFSSNYHREDGPAIIFDEGYPYDDLGSTARCQWYLNGRNHSFEEWCEEMKKTDEEIIFLKLKYGM